MIESYAIMLGGICTIAIYSFLYKENSLYRTFEHLFIGIATGWGFVVAIREFLWPKFLGALFGYTMVTLPDGTVVTPYDYNNLWYLIPVFFSSFYYFIYSAKYRYLAQLVISFQFGCAGGLAFKGFFVEVLPQVYDCFRPLVERGGDDTLQVSWSNIIFIITLLSAFSYFFFTFSITNHKSFAGIRTTGRMLMMVCFGAFFGSTMMARMALLVERIDFMANDWVGALAVLFGSGGAGV